MINALIYPFRQTKTPKLHAMVGCRGRMEFLWASSLVGAKYDLII
jgi:hypothetical protein